MAVARADGQVDRVEVQTVRERVVTGLKIPSSEKDVVTSILRAEPSAPLRELLADLRLRAPRTRPSAILSALADVARADQKIHLAEAATIAEVARLLGIEEARWQILSHQFGLSGVDHLLHYRQLLNVDPQATPEEIEAAYRQQMAQYDPDRVAGLPEDFQELAWRKTESLTRARDALLRAIA